MIKSGMLLFMAFLLSCVSTQSLEKSVQKDTLLQLLNIDIDKFELLIYEGHHYDENIQKIKNQLILNVSEKKRMNYFIEKNNEDIQLYSYFINNDSIKHLANYFSGFNFLFQDSMKLKESFEFRVKNGEIKLTGIDCQAFYPKTISVIIDSTSELLSKHKSLFTQGNIDSVFQILKLAPFLTTHLSTIENEEFRLINNMYKSIQIIGSNNLRESWKNINQFFFWVSKRGALMPSETKNKLSSFELMKWHSVRDSIMYLNYAEKSLEIAKLNNIIVLGSSHCRRRGLIYTNTYGKLYEKSFSDLLIENRPLVKPKRILITSTDLVTIKGSKNITKKKIFYNGIRLEIVTLKIPDQAKSVFFDLINYSNTFIKANWFMAFDFLVIVDRGNRLEATSF